MHPSVVTLSESCFHLGNMKLFTFDLFSFGREHAFHNNDLPSVGEHAVSDMVYGLWCRPGFHLLVLALTRP